MLSAFMFRVIHADVYLFVSCWPDCFSACDYAFMSCCLPYWPWLHSDIKMFLSCWADYFPAVDCVLMSCCLPRWPLLFTLMLNCLCFAEQIILSADNHVFMSCCMPFWSELFMLMLNCLCLADKLSCRLCVNVMLSALMFRVVHADVYLFVSCWPDCFSAADDVFLLCCLPRWP